MIPIPGAAVPSVHIDWHRIVDLGTRTVATCSVLHTLLPPWDWEPDFVKVGLADFPRAQSVFRGAFHNRWYKLLVYTVGYIALNARSTVWQSISVKRQFPTVPPPTPLGPPTP